MIKSELVNRLSESNPHVFHRDMEKVVNAVLSEIATALERGNRIEIRGFGAFSVKVRAARASRNPRTGAPVQVDSKKRPYFRMGKELRKRLNSPDRISD
jgi:integration host factor subunit beta